MSEPLPMLLAFLRTLLNTLALLDLSLSQSLLSLPALTSLPSVVPGLHADLEVLKTVISGFSH